MKCVNDEREMRVVGGDGRGWAGWEEEKEGEKGGGRTGEKGGGRVERGRARRGRVRTCSETHV